MPDKAENHLHGRVASLSSAEALLRCKLAVSLSPDHFKRQLEKLSGKVT